MQIIDSRTESVIKFSLRENFKQSRAYEEGNEKMGKEINLDAVQSITNADMVLDSTIVDLRDCVDYRQVNTVVCPSPLYRQHSTVIFRSLMPSQYEFEVMNNLPTHRDSHCDGQLDCFLLDSCLRPPALKFDYKKYEQFIQ